MRYKLVALTIAGITRIAPVSANMSDMLSADVGHMIMEKFTMPDYETHQEKAERMVQEMVQQQKERDTKERERERDSQNSHDGAGCAWNIWD